MLGEIAFLHFDLAAAANAAAAAHALDIDAELAGGLEDVRAFLETTATTGRHEQDQRVLLP